MKDFDGNLFDIGDTVAIIYHPQAYEFSVEAAVIREVKGKKKMIVAQLLNSEATAGFYPDESGEIYPKIVKIHPEHFSENSDEHIDAVGHIIHIGDRVSCRKPTEAGGNTVKGFEKGGIVVNLTDHYVFFTDEMTGEKKRKGYNGVVVY